jgi:uncharacterized integral membrane protein
MGASQLCKNLGQTTQVLMRAMYSLFIGSFLLSCLLTAYHLINIETTTIHIFIAQEAEGFHFFLS